MTPAAPPCRTNYLPPRDKVQLVQLPTRTGAEIRIDVIVREVLCDGYVIDTAHQRGLKVRGRDLDSTGTTQ